MVNDVPRLQGRVRHAVPQGIDVIAVAERGRHGDENPYNNHAEPQPGRDRRVVGTRPRRRPRSRRTRGSRRRTARSGTRIPSAPPRSAPRPGRSARPRGRRAGRRSARASDAPAGRRPSRSVRSRQDACIDRRDGNAPGLACSSRNIGGPRRTVSSPRAGATLFPAAGIRIKRCGAGRSATGTTEGQLHEMARDDRPDAPIGDGDGPAGLGGVGPPPSWSGEPRLNQIQVIGTHNSYHIAPAPAILELVAGSSRRQAEGLDYSHRPFAEQFSDLGIRQIELDVFADPKGGLFAEPTLRKIVEGPGQGPRPRPECRRSAPQARPEGPARPGRRLPHPCRDVRRRPEAGPGLVEGPSASRPDPDPGRAQGRGDLRPADPAREVRPRRARRGRRRDPLGVRPVGGPDARPRPRPVRDAARGDPLPRLARARLRPRPRPVRPGQRGRDPRPLHRGAPRAQGSADVRDGRQPRRPPKPPGSRSTIRSRTSTASSGSSAMASWSAPGPMPIPASPAPTTAPSATRRWPAVRSSSAPITPSPTVDSRITACGFPGGVVARANPVSGDPAWGNNDLEGRQGGRRPQAGMSHRGSHWPSRSVRRGIPAPGSGRRSPRRWPSRPPCRPGWSRRGRRG